jgi:hypothetical protein
LDFIAGTQAKIIGTVSIEDDAALAALTQAMDGRYIRFEQTNGSADILIENSTITKAAFLANLEVILPFCTRIFNAENKLEITKNYAGEWQIRLNGDDDYSATRDAFFGSNPTYINGTAAQN